MIAAQPAGYLEAHYASGGTGLIPVRGSTAPQLREAARVMSRTHQIRVNVLGPDREQLWAFVNGSDVDTAAKPTRTRLWKILRLILPRR